MEISGFLVMAQSCGGLGLFMMKGGQVGFMVITGLYASGHGITAVILTDLA